MKSFKLIPLSLLLSGMIFQIPLHAQNQPTSRIDTMTDETITYKKTPRDIKITPAQDALIAKRVESLIKASPTLSKLNVKVESHEGVVNLSGTADADSQVTALVEFAQSVYGVKDVETKNLQVKASDNPFDDSLITAKIRGLLIQQDLFGKEDVPSINISVETKNGKVYLTGVVNNQQQIDTAMQLIRNVKGVKSVEFHMHRLIIPSEMKAKNMQIK